MSLKGIGAEGILFLLLRLFLCALLGVLRFLGRFRGAHRAEKKTLYNCWIECFQRGIEIQLLLQTEIQIKREALKINSWQIRKSSKS